VTIVHYKFYHELKNAWNVVKFYTYILNFLIFHLSQKGIISKYSHKDMLLQSALLYISIDPNKTLNLKFSEVQFMEHL